MYTPPGTYYPAHGVPVDIYAGLFTRDGLSTLVDGLSEDLSVEDDCSGNNVGSPHSFGKRSDILYLSIPAVVVGLLFLTTMDENTSRVGGAGLSVAALLLTYHGMRD